MRGKEEMTGRGKQEKAETTGDQIAKKKSVRIFFLCVVVIFLNYQKYAISTFVFMQNFSMNILFDFQELNIQHHPLFCNSSKILWQS